MKLTDDDMRMAEAVERAIKAAKAAIVAEAEKMPTEAEKFGVVMISSVQIFEDMLSSITQPKFGKPTPILAKVTQEMIENSTVDELMLLSEMAKQHKG